MKQIDDLINVLNEEVLSVNEKLVSGITNVLSEVAKNRIVFDDDIHIRNRIFICTLKSVYDSDTFECPKVVLVYEDGTKLHENINDMTTDFLVELSYLIKDIINNK